MDRRMGLHHPHDAATDASFSSSSFFCFFVVVVVVWDIGQWMRANGRWTCERSGRHQSVGAFFVLFLRARFRTMRRRILLMSIDA